MTATALRPGRHPAPLLDQSPGWARALPGYDSVRVLLDGPWAAADGLPMPSGGGVDMTRIKSSAADDRRG